MTTQPLEFYDFGNAQMAIIRTSTPEGKAFMREMFASMPKRPAPLTEEQRAAAWRRSNADLALILAGRGSEV